MILEENTLRKRVRDKSIILEPFEEAQIQAASIDLHLADEFLVLDDHLRTYIDLSSKMDYRRIRADDFVLPPHSFILASTREYMEIPLDLCCRLEGRSGIGRLGLFIQNAGWIDPGFKGNVTLEFYNANSLPIKLEVGRRICQLVFMKLYNPLKSGYKGRYLGQRGVTGSKVYEDVEV